MKPTLYWYVRLSDDDTNKTSDSLKNQETLGKKRAKEWKMNIKIYNEGIQKSWDPDRPIMKKLLEETLKNHQPGDKVGFKDQDRLARSQGIIETWTDLFTKEGIPLVDNTGRDLTKTPLETGIRAVLDKEVITKGRKDAKLSRENKKEQQQTQFRPPKGYKTKWYYRKGKITKKTWIIDKKNAKIIKEIFDKAIEQKKKYGNINYTHLSLYFDIPRNTIKGIIKNKTYKGIIEYKEGNKTINYKLEKSIPRIINKKTWEEAQ